MLFLVSVMATAQQEISTAYADAVNNMFAPLDKTRIPHKILLDFGFEYTNLKAFNGTLTDSTVVDAQTLKHIYNTLFSSRVTSATTGFINPNNFDSNWKTYRTAGIITVSGLYYKYNAFINDAINLGKINFVNNQFQDKFVSGVWQNPYQEFQAFAMAPAITKYEGLNFKVKIPSTIFYSNYQSLVQSIQIDFGNGAGYVTVPFNQNVTINYTTEGVKVWKYKLNLTNGTSLLSQSKIEVTQGISTIPWGSLSPATTAMATTSVASSTIYSHNITATKNFGGVYGTVKLTIDDTNNDGIRKPLIVAEGFDAGIILAPEMANGMNTYKIFRRSILDSQNTELQSLLWNTNKQYDIIYVDWDNGVDYLQKNAFALEAVIAWVNSVKIGTEKNVVVGQSMGGVIARYALADMEQSSLDHKTRLFVSHDAPQQGANIPISVQYMFRHVTNLYNRYAFPYGVQVIDVPFLENSILDQPATKQMLMNWVNGYSNIDNTISSSFYNELKGKGLANSGGYPINCRNIAISNGAECGITQGFNAGDNLLSYNMGGRLPFLQNLLVPFVGFLGGIVYSDPALFAIGFVGLLPGQSSYDVDFWAKSIPYGFGNQIYKGRISYTKKLFKIFGWAPTITVNITNAQKDQPVGVLPIDHYAGGMYDTTLFTSGATLPSGMYIRDRFNFIPTPSALDIGRGNVSLNDTDYKMAYVGATPPLAPKNSPFANFSTDFEKYNPNASNKMHISLNSRNGDWLAKELNVTPITTNCSYRCADTQIFGQNLICPLASATYTAPVVTAVNNWAITQGANLVTLSGNGTPNVILTALPNTVGDVTLSLTMGDNWAKCGNITITKTIHIGSPIIDYTSSSSFISGVYGWYCAGFANNASPTVITTPTATSYKWYIDLDQDIAPNCSFFSTPSLAKITNNNSIVTTTASAIYQSSSNTCNINWGNCTGQYLLRCYAVNDCGETPYLMKYVTVGRAADNPCTQDTGMSRYAVFPNPIKDGTITVNFTPSQLPCDPPTEYKTIVNNTVKDVKIFDMQGNQMFQNKYEEEETFSIKGLNLKTGYYIINITFPNGIIEKQVIIVE